MTLSGGPIATPFKDLPPSPPQTRVPLPNKGVHRLHKSVDMLFSNEDIQGYEAPLGHEDAVLEHMVVEQALQNISVGASEVDDDQGADAAGEHFRRALRVRGRVHPVGDGPGGQRLGVGG